MIARCTVCLEDFVTHDRSERCLDCKIGHRSHQITIIGTSPKKREIITAFTDEISRDDRAKNEEVRRFNEQVENFAEIDALIAIGESDHAATGFAPADSTDTDDRAGTGFSDDSGSFGGGGSSSDYSSGTDSSSNSSDCSSSDSSVCDSGSTSD